jgi:hypothetical protein
MLSSTTMVLSMVMPMAKAMPASEMTLMVRSSSSSPMKPATVQTGMPTCRSGGGAGAEEQEHHQRREHRADEDVLADVATESST